MIILHVNFFILVQLIALIIAVCLNCFNCSADRVILSPRNDQEKQMLPLDIEHVSTDGKHKTQEHRIDQLQFNVDIRW